MQIPNSKILIPIPIPNFVDLFLKLLGFLKLRGFIFETSSTLSVTEWQSGSNQCEKNLALLSVNKSVNKLTEN